MGMRINTNTQAMAAQRNLFSNKIAQDNSLEKLSSGQRINKAGDDAAGLAISERLKATIRSTGQATRNASDGISMIQVAEGSMNEISNILIRMRELSMQTASDTVGNLERGYVDKEVQHLKSELDRISNTTEFNGHKLLNGTAGQLEFQVGVNNNPDEDRLTFEAEKQVVNLESLSLGGISTASKESSQENLASIDNAINIVNENRSSLGALQNRLTSTINNLMIFKENNSAANSRIRDTDMAQESSELTRNNILTQSNTAMLAQANQNPQLALRLVTG